MRQQSLSTRISSAHLRVTSDTRLGTILARDPTACDRLQALGLPEPILCGPYRERPVADLARGTGIPLETLIGVLGGRIG